MAYLSTKNSYLNVSSARIAYRKLGKPKTTPLVMLVHLGATLDNWDPKLIDLLAKKRQLILLDLPGVGASKGKVAVTISKMAKQALAIIKALELKEIDLLGLSMGGMIAQELVKLDQTLVKHLILVGTGPKGGLGIDQVTQTAFKYMLKAGLTRSDPKRYIFYEHDTAGKAEADKVLARLASRPAQYADKKMQVSGFLRQLKAIKRYGSAKPTDLNFITCPTLIVNGDNDLMVPTKNSYVMHQKIKDSQLVIYPKAGHGSLFQYADEFAVTLNDFLG